jgi:D-sedoheptulose 7-phosphate isomerase
MNKRIPKTGIEIARLFETFHTENSEKLQTLVTRLVGTFTGGGRLLVAAGGNLQPIAQMTASHFTNRLGFYRPSLPAVALGADATLAASLARSNQQQLLLARHYRSLGSNNHLLLLLSDGAADPQLTELVRIAKDDQPLALLTPQKNTDPELSGCTDLQLLIDTDSPARLLELSLFCGNLLCELVEAELFGV